MAYNLGAVEASAKLNNSEFIRNLKGLETSSEQTFKKIGGMVATYLSFRAVFSGIRMVTREFSNLEEAVNKFNIVFGEIPKAAAAAELALRKNFNLSEQTSKQMLASAADQLVAFGFAADEALKMAQKVVDRGVDLSSFKGGTQTEAIESITSALTGMTVPMKKYGVVIRQDSEEFRQLVTNIRAATGATEQQAQSQAILETILAQSTNAAGDYNREGETIWQTQMDIAEATKATTAAIGDHLANAIHPAMKGYRDLVRGFANMSKANQQLVINTTALSGVMLVLRTRYVRTTVAAVQATVAQRGFAGSIKASALAVKGLIASFGPIGWIAAALSAMFMGVSWLKQRQMDKLTAATELAETSLQEATKNREAIEQRNTAMEGSINRLERLSKFQRLNNNQMNEAQYHIDALKKHYEGLDIGIDRTTGKVTAQKKAFEELRQEMEKQAIEEKKKEAEKALNVAEVRHRESIGRARGDTGSWHGLDYGSSTYKTVTWLLYRLQDDYKKEHGTTEGFFAETKDRYGLTPTPENLDYIARHLRGTKEYEDRLPPAVKKFFDEIAATQGDLDEATKNLDDINSGKHLENLKNEAAKIQNEALEGYKAWFAEYQFNNADDTGKSKMLSDQLMEKYKEVGESTQMKDLAEELQLLTESKDIKSAIEQAKNVLGAFGKASDINDMAPDQLKLQQEILELEDQRAKINQRIADAAQRHADAIADEKRNYAKYNQSLADDMRQYQIGRVLKGYTDAGNDGAAYAIIQGMLHNTQIEAANARKAYDSALARAGEETALTAEERQKLSDAMDKMREAESRALNWNRRRDSFVDEARQGRTSTTANVALSGKILSGMLGFLDPQRQIANNTKESNRILKRIEQHQNDAQGDTWGN